MSPRLTVSARWLPRVGRRLLASMPPRAASALRRLARRWIEVRVPFYEAYDQGQMTAKERALVRDTVRRVRPRVCVELGTWRGGGSTYQIATALAENGDGGLLYTYEPDAEHREAALDNYRREAPALLPHLRFHGEDFLEGIEHGGPARIDFALLDGPDDAQYTRNALRVVGSRLGAGAYVILHDWHEEKCRLVRGDVAVSDGWVVDRVYADTPTGLARLRRRGR